MRVAAIRSAASRFGPDCAGLGSPCASSMSSTRYTSAPSSLNTPAMPVCEAMLSSIARMCSKSAPCVSVRR